MGKDSDLLDVQGLLKRAGIDAGTVTVEPTEGGRNNQAFVVYTNSNRYFLKRYYRHPSDSRDRIASETAFLLFCQQAGLSSTPRLIAWDHDAGIALMEYIRGSRITRENLTREHVNQALTFFAELNRHRQSPLASRLPPAADSRDSALGHLELVAQRVARLSAIQPDSPESAQVLQLVEKRLIPLWRQVRDRVQSQVERVEKAHLTREQMVLSPSDFGFHNSILRPGGELVFVDFEYAGWDDPAKTFADFFLQPAIPPPRDRMPDALEIIQAAAGAPPEFEARTQLLFPVFGIKWCCILLNEFLPDGSARRGFAQRHIDPTKRRREQIERLESLLDQLESEALL